MPPALNGCPKCKKLPNLVTLVQSTNPCAIYYMDHFLLSLVGKIVFFLTRLKIKKRPAIANFKTRQAVSYNIGTVWIWTAYSGVWSNCSANCLTSTAPSFKCFVNTKPLSIASTSVGFKYIMYYFRWEKNHFKLKSLTIEAIGNRPQNVSFALSSFCYWGKKIQSCFEALSL